MHPTRQTPGIPPTRATRQIQVAVPEAAIHVPRNQDRLATLVRLEAAGGRGRIMGRSCRRGCPMSEELAIPGTGELVDLSDEVSCAQALMAVRDFERNIREAKAALTAAIVERSRVLGTKTIHLSDGRKAEIRGGSETTYDAHEIEEGLRALGMPEDRIREIIIEEISYKVSAREAQRAGAANEDYKSVIENAKRIEEKSHYVVIK